jgi:hypothetical protein
MAEEPNREQAARNERMKACARNAASHFGARKDDRPHQPIRPAN